MPLICLTVASKRDFESVSETDPMVVSKHTKVVFKQKMPTSFYLFLILTW